MKYRRGQQRGFVQQLREIIASLKNMKRDEVHIINVRANYGNYQIVIGPEAKIHPGGKGRPIEINGKLHHLFVSPARITPNPTHEQIEHNMKDTVIMRDLTVHIIDEEGDGQHITRRNGNNHVIEAREFINLAGESGATMLKQAKANGRLSQAAYQIIQEDILHALKEYPEESIEEEKR